MTIIEYVAGFHEVANHDTSSHTIEFERVRCFV